MLVGEFGIMKTGDFVSIDYVGRVKESGEVFDVTVEEVAKKEKVHDPKVVYKPINVVVGADFIVKGLDDALKDMKVGDKRTVVVDPENGFGQRDAKFIRPIPLSNFKGENVDPTPGSWITINGVRGRILSADGGRIRVDFNHPLAGKRLEYEIEIKSEILDAAEKVKAIVGYVTGLETDKIEAKLEGSEAEIKAGEERELPAQAKKRVADLAMKWVAGVEKVKFVDEYGK